MKTCSLRKTYLSLDEIISTISCINEKIKEKKFDFYADSDNMYMSLGDIQERKTFYSFCDILFQDCNDPNIDGLKSLSWSSSNFKKVLTSNMVKIRDSIEYQTLNKTIPQHFVNIFHNNALRKKVVLNLIDVIDNFDLEPALSTLLNHIELTNHRNFLSYLNNILKTKSHTNYAYVILTLVVFSVAHDENHLRIHNVNDEISNLAKQHETNDNTIFPSLFSDSQYQTFTTYFYDDYQTDQSEFCKGKITFCDNGDVTFKFEKSEHKEIIYKGHAKLFAPNKLAFIELIKEGGRDSGALLVFHYSHYPDDPQKVFLRKGFFISTATTEQNFRPYVKNIILLHTDAKDEQIDLIKGMLKCSDMRNMGDFVIIKSGKQDTLWNKICNLDFVNNASENKTAFFNFLDGNKTNKYFVFREDDLDHALKTWLSIDLQRSIVAFVIKSESELPNSIYPYKCQDELFTVFKDN